MANSIDAFIPEWWAMEALMLLWENTVMAPLVHTDFSDEIAKAGDIVHTRRPAAFVMKRKTDADNVTDQDATATDVQINLDQHAHVSFVIKDGEESKGLGSLRSTYLEPAIKAIAQGIDEVLLGLKYEFYTNVAGFLGTTVTRGTFLNTGKTLDESLCPVEGRRMIISPQLQADLLNIDAFSEADKLADGGEAVRNASLGRKFGFDILMSQNCRTITASDTTAGAVNNAAGYAAGSTSITVDGLTAAITAGTWCTIAGDMTPQMITASVGGSIPTSITITPGLKTAVLNDAVLTLYDPAAINYSDGYAAAYNKDTIAIDGITLAPRQGQMVSMEATAAAVELYAALQTPTATAVFLNKSLETAASNNDVVGLGPAGEYGFAFNRNAIALISRPLALPASGLALSSVQNYNGIGLRVTITYDGQTQGHRVTVDVLMGVKVLDTNLGALMLA
jgi:hypothetical protein